MPYIRAILSEEYERLKEKKEDYEQKLKTLNPDNHERREQYEKALASIKEDMTFIEKAFRANQKRSTRGVYTMDDAELLNLQIQVFRDAIKALHNAGALPHIIIVGSWAEHIYKETDTLNLTRILKTQDMDILIPNINYPREKIDIISAFEGNGFVLRQDINGLMKVSLT